MCGEKERNLLTVAAHEGVIIWLQQQIPAKIVSDAPEILHYLNITMVAFLAACARLPCVKMRLARCTGCPGPMATGHSSHVVI